MAISIAPLCAAINVLIDTLPTLSACPAHSDILRRLALQAFDLCDSRRFHPYIPERQYCYAIVKGRPYPYDNAAA